MQPLETINFPALEKWLQKNEGPKYSIPKTSWTYDTKEDSDWSWGSDSKYVRVYKLNIIHGITQEELAELYDTTQSSIARWAKKGKKKQTNE